MRWSRNIVMASVLLLGSGISFAGPGDPDAAARSSADMVLGQFGSASGIQNNAVQPMMSNNKLLCTLDGSKCDSARVSSSPSNKFLEISVQLSGTGDLGQVIVNEDLTMNGSLSSSFSVPFPVSGICVNGVIGCDAGTWNNCIYYQWNADIYGRLSLVPSAINELSSCYCINKSCGSNLDGTDLPVTLRSLGGGVIAAIQSKIPNVVVSDVSIKGAGIMYYGPQADGSASVTTPAAPANLTQYSAEQQSVDPYRIMEGLAAARDGSFDFSAIQNRMGTITNSISRTSGTSMAYDDYYLDRTSGKWTSSPGNAQQSINWFYSDMNR